MELSERIKYKRTDRPDEWSMDELQRMAERLEAIITERDATISLHLEQGFQYAKDLNEARKQLHLINEQLVQALRERNELRDEIEGEK